MMTTSLWAVTVFNDSSQMPVARAGDLGIFRLFSAGNSFIDIDFLRAVQANIDSLVPGTLLTTPASFMAWSSEPHRLCLRIIQNLIEFTTGAVVLYKTNESENGLKLATVLSGPQQPDTGDAGRGKWHAGEGD
jgi:hypothetical protein